MKENRLYVTAPGRLLRLSVLFVAVGGSGALGAWNRIDVTAAVREAGDKRTVTANITQSTRPGGGSIASAFDGKASVLTEALFSEYCYGGTQPVKDAYANGGVTLEYQIASDFEAGKDIVIDGYSIMTGSNVSHAQRRLPSTWKFQAYDEEQADWITLDEWNGFMSWKSPTFDGQTQYGADFHFVNSKAYRRYRFLITAQYWITEGVWTEADALDSGKGALVISEIQLWGYVGENIDDKIYAGAIDLTEAVRRVGPDARKISANITKYGEGYELENAFDGSAVTSGGTDRFFSGYAQVSNAYEHGGAYIEYEFDSLYAHGADIVVTGYSIMTGRDHLYAFLRLPCDWKFQAYDEARSEWTTLDEYENFKLWDNTLAWNGGSQVGFDFAITNSAAYRRYRLLITRQVWGTIDGYNPSQSNMGALQISEIRLLGHVGKDIAGTIETASAEYPLRFVDWATVKYGTYTATTPTITGSAYTSLGDSLEHIFNGKKEDRGFCWLNDAEGHTGEIPFYLSYELPESAMAGRTVKLTNYVIEVNKTFNGWDVGLPRSWQLEAKYGDKWIVIDRRSDFNDWGERSFTYANGEGTACYGSFAIAEDRQFSSTRYRLRVDSLAGKYNNRNLFMLSENTVDGTWGVDIVRREQRLGGLHVIFR